MNARDGPATEDERMNGMGAHMSEMVMDTSSKNFEPMMKLLPGQGAINPLLFTGKFKDATMRIIALHRCGLHPSYVVWHFSETSEG